MVLYAYLSLLAYGLLDNFRGPYFTEILTAMDVQDGVGAWYFALTSLFAALASYACVGLFKRRGITFGLHVSGLSMAAGFGVIAVAENFFWILLGAVFFGIGAGMGNLAQNSAVSEGGYPVRRPSQLAGLHAMYGLASMLAPWLAHELLERGVSFRGSFGLVAIAPLLVVILGFFRQRHRRKKYLHDADSHLPRLTSMQRRHAIVLASAIACYLLAEISVGTRMVRWLELDRAMTASQGSMYLAGFFGCLLAGRLLAWWKSPHEELPLFRALLIGATAGGIALTIALTVWPFTVLAVGLILGRFYPLSIAYLRLRFEKLSPRALGITLGVGSFAIVLMHVSMGLLADRFGQTTAMAVGPIGLGLSAALLLVETRYNRS